jgi:hypothetical protein
MDLVSSTFVAFDGDGDMFALDGDSADEIVSIKLLHNLLYNISATYKSQIQSVFFMGLSNLLVAH